VQDLYTASKDNQAFLHARLGLGHDQLQPFKACISNWIFPNVINNQAISVSKAKKAIADYKKAIGRPEGMAELSTFYCEEAFGFLESCGWKMKATLLLWSVCMDGPSNSYQTYLLPSAPPTSSASTSLEPAGGRSDGGSRKNSIAFGTLQLWTSTSVESRLVLSVRLRNWWGAAAEQECPLCRYPGETGRSADIAKIIGTLSSLPETRQKLATRIAEEKAKAEAVKREYARIEERRRAKELEFKQQWTMQTRCSKGWGQMLCGENALGLGRAFLVGFFLCKLPLTE
jgi:hypothetical protein